MYFFFCFSFLPSPEEVLCLVTIKEARLRKYHLFPSSHILLIILVMWRPGHGAHGKPLQIAGRTQHLDIQWGEARGRASFIVIVGLESLPCLIGMDIMRPLCVHIDVTNGTAAPAQPDPQTVHLNAAQSQQQRKEMSLPGAGLRSPQTADLPPTQSQRKEKPLLEAGSPTMGTASPPQISQQREEIQLPKAHPSPMGAADSSQIHKSSRNERK